MEALLLPSLVASSVGLFVYGVGDFVRRLLDPDRRRLAQRLSGTETVRDSFDTSPIRLLSDDPDAHIGRLGRYRAARELNRAVVQAFPNTTLHRFLMYVGGAGTAGFLVVTTLTLTPIVGLVAAGLGGSVPFLLMTRKRHTRQRQLAGQIPDALDFLGRSLKAGHSLSVGLQMMGSELPQPLAGEFRRAYDQHSLGLPMEEALREMVMRIESTDFAFFVTAVLIQRQTGGDLSEVLANISGMIRQRVRLQQHVKAKTAEGRFTGYILAAFPAVMFVVAYVLNPTYAGPLVHTTTGLTLLGVALVMQCMGLVFIKRLTTVRV